MAHIDGSETMQTVLSSTRHGSIATLSTITASILEVHMFSNSIEMVDSTIQSKNLKHLRSYSTETLIGYTAQKVFKAWVLQKQLILLHLQIWFPLTFC